MQNRLANIQLIYRKGKLSVNSAQQNIVSMDKAISLAVENAKITSDEIAYLRQQLIIGGSTLDSVLSAEARLYDAESKEIEFIAARRASELQFLAAIGLLAQGLEVDSK